MTQAQRLRDYRMFDPKWNIYTVYPLLLRLRDPCKSGARRLQEPEVVKTPRKWSSPDPAGQLCRWTHSRWDGTHKSCANWHQKFGNWWLLGDGEPVFYKGINSGRLVVLQWTATYLRVWKQHKLAWRDTFFLRHKITWIRKEGGSMSCERGWLWPHALN